MSHTPGPWIVDGIAVDAANSTVCIMGEMDGFESGYRPAMNYQANSQLIAAAPDLLAALERLCYQAELTDDYEESEHSTLRSAARQARAAIAKAKGVQP